MNTTTLLDLPNIVVDSLSQYGSQYQLACHSTISNALCPHCHQKSIKVKSYYTRKIQDLPITNHTVWLFIPVRKFICLNPKCSYHIFTEPISFAAKNAQRTGRLNKLILQTVAERSSIATSALLENVGIELKKTAICELLKKTNLTSVDRFV